MSKFRVHKSMCESYKAILAAIKDRIVQFHCIGAWKEDTPQLKAEWSKKADKLIEDHVIISKNEPIHLYGYRDDMRKETANIRISKDLVNQHMGGGLSNDVGFLKTEEGFDAIVSDYDKSRWFNSAQDRFWQIADATQAVEDAWDQPNITDVEMVEDEETQQIEIYCHFSD